MLSAALIAGVWAAYWPLLTAEVVTVRRTGTIRLADSKLPTLSALSVVLLPAAGLYVAHGRAAVAAFTMVAHPVLIAVPLEWARRRMPSADGPVHSDADPVLEQRRFLREGLLAAAPAALWAGVLTALHGGADGTADLASWVAFSFVGVALATWYPFTIIWVFESRDGLRDLPLKAGLLVLALSLLGPVFVDADGLAPA